MLVVKENMMSVACGGEMVVHDGGEQKAKKKDWGIEKRKVKEGKISSKGEKKEKKNYVFRP